MFPLSVDGRVRIRTTRDDAEILSAVGAALEAACPGTIARQRDGHVDFRVLLFGAGWRSNWNILVPYDGGQVRVVRQGGEVWLAYSNSVRRLLAFATGATMIMGLLAGLMTHDPGEGLQIFGGMWLWLFGMNYLIAMLRFGGWLARAV